MCVLTNKKNVKRERDESARKKQKRKSRRKTTDKERELPEKKRSKKRDKNSLFFSLPIGGGVWRYSVVVLIILRIITTIKASESCNSSRALSKEAKERSTGKRELFVQNKRD